MFRNHGEMPSGPCDLEVLIFDSWSCTPLIEIVSMDFFSMWAVIQIWYFGISFKCEHTFKLIAYYSFLLQTFVKRRISMTSPFIGTYTHCNK